LPEPILARAKAILEGLERGRKKQPQLGLFETPAPVKDESNAALDMLRALDVERITPIEALTTLAKLKDLAGNEQK
jgi:DNA mismatch repair protein MutS